MQGIGMLIKPHYIKDYTVQNHPVQGPTVPEPNPNPTFATRLHH